MSEPAWKRLGLGRPSITPRSQRFAASGLPQEFWDLRWRDIEPTAIVEVDRTRVPLLDVARQWVTMWQDTAAEEPCEGLVITGSPGCGKTMVAAMMALSVLDRSDVEATEHWRAWAAERGMDTTWARRRGRCDEGDEPTIYPHLVRFTSVSRWQQRMKALIGQDVEEQATIDELRRLEFIRYADVLVFDDPGNARQRTDWRGDTVNELLRDRVMLGLPTIVTANLTTDAEWEALNPSLGSFIHQVGLVVNVVEGQQYRTARNSKLGRMVADEAR